MKSMLIRACILAEAVIIKDSDIGNQPGGKKYSEQAPPPHD